MENHHAILNVLDQVPSPSFVVDETKLRQNALICNKIRQESGAIILLALKGFSMFSVFDQLLPYLDGSTASSLHEAKLGHDYFGTQHHHIFSPAFKASEWDEISRYCTHVSFNSPSQWAQFKPKISPLMSPGLRLNPEHSEVKTALYDPCHPNCRLGITKAELERMDITGIEGFHIHSLCESQFPALERTVAVIEEKFGNYLNGLKWLNLGGGHHITTPDYDREGLIALVKRLKNQYDLEIILEPGEAVALNTGYYVSEVLDILDRQPKHAIIDGSASTHLPDVLEMPYRPHILGSHPEGKTPHSYRLGGTTCLAGDHIGTYSFDKPLKIGQKLVFTDMAHYTMVKTTTFNGVALPSIGRIDQDGQFSLQKTFGYSDFAGRLS